mgnify:CR=1 FL=1
MTLDRGTLLLIAGAISLSFAGVFVELVDAIPDLSAFYRMVFGGAVLTIIAIYQKQVFFHGWRPFLFQVLAAACFAGDLIVWHRSIVVVGTGLATLLANFQVFLLTLVGILFLHERPGWMRLVAIPVALLGLFFVVGMDWQDLDADYQNGVLLGLLTAVFYGSYILVLPGTQRRGVAPTHFANMACISVLTAVLLGLYGLSMGTLTMVHGADLFWLLLYGVGCQALGQVFLYKGRLVTLPSKVGLVLLLQPTFAFAWDSLIFGRSPALRQYLGAGLALFAIWMGTRARSRAPRKLQAPEPPTPGESPQSRS